MLNWPEKRPIPASEHSATSGQGVPVLFLGGCSWTRSPRDERPYFVRELVRQRALVSNEQAREGSVPTRPRCASSTLRSEAADPLLAHDHAIDEHFCRRA